MLWGHQSVRRPPPTPWKQVAILSKSQGCVLIVAGANGGPGEKCTVRISEAPEPIFLALHTFCTILT